MLIVLKKNIQYDWIWHFAEDHCKLVISCQTSALQCDPVKNFKLLFYSKDFLKEKSFVILLVLFE